MKTATTNTTTTTNTTVTTTAAAADDETTKTIKKLIETCEILEQNTPYEDYYTSNHWNQTLDEIKEFHLEITDEIITCLSLSRFYGPTPSLTGTESDKVFIFLWPNGNPKGSWFTWSELSDSLKSYESGIN
jgi:hypothetical protein